jgi:hypothetical protein
LQELYLRTLPWNSSLIKEIFLPFVQISPDNMKISDKILFSGLLIFLAALTLGSISSPERSGRKSPQYEGEIVATGLFENVTGYRNDRGIPHIYPINEYDMMSYII